MLRIYGTQLSFAAPFVAGCCLCLVGCGLESETVLKPLELVPPTSVVVPDPSVLTTTVPVGMTVTRNVLIRSRFDTALTHLRTASSCGCTSAEFAKEILNPGEVGTLSCVFDANSRSMSQHVKIQIFSPDTPSGSFSIDMQFNTTLNSPGNQISSVPKRITVDELWKNKREDRHALKLTLGDRVPRSAIEVGVSADFLRAELRGDSLSVVLDSPAVGNIDEYVELSFPNENDMYSLRIPIKGRIRPLIRVEPQVLSFGAVPRGEDMVGEVQLEAANGSTDTPLATLKGDWKLRSLERLSDRTWKLRVCLKSLDGSDVRYGQLLVKGNWQGDEIRIPLTGTFAGEPE